MNDGTNYAEYAVSKKAEGNNLLARIFLIIGYIALPVVLLIWAWYIGAIMAMIVAIVWFLTWRFVAYDYETVAASGVISFYKTIGKKKHKLCEFKIKDCETIAPYEGEYKAQIGTVGVTRDLRGSKKSTDAYFLTVDDAGKKTLVIFEITNKMMKILAYYNSKTIKCDHISK